MTSASVGASLRGASKTLLDPNLNLFSDSALNLTPLAPHAAMSREMERNYDHKKAVEQSDRLPGFSILRKR